MKRKERKTYKSRSGKGRNLFKAKTLDELYPQKRIRYVNPYFVKNDMKTKLKMASKKYRKEDDFDFT